MSESRRLSKTEIEGRPWHVISPAEAVRILGTDRDRGLSADEVERRRAIFGENKLPDAERDTLLRIVARQFKDPLIYILLIAGLASLAIGSFDDAVFIFAVLVLNASLGSYQEYKAELAAQSLEEMIKIIVQVKRDGRTEALSSEELVPGDVVVASPGRSVPADIRLVSSHDLRVDESLLTGESTPVDKQVEAELEQDASLGDRTTLLHAGSMVMSGRGTGVVCAIGDMTELGRIAESLTSKQQAAPLVIRMRKFTRVIAIGILTVVVVLGGIQLARGISFLNVFMLAVALSVSAIPAGLPAAITVALARASSRMAGRNVIVRKLPAVEGLGACTLIASDKTGTLTANELMVQRIRPVAGPDVEVEGAGYAPVGELVYAGRGARKPVDVDREAWIRRLASSAALCNEAELEVEDDELQTQGDTVDLAFLVLARKLQMSREDLLEAYPEVGQIPFESERRFAASFHRHGDAIVAHVKGAAHTLLGMCANVDRAEIERQEQDLASHGFRVIAVACGPVDARVLEDHERLNGLEFLGLVGLIDPIRAGVLEAVDKCHHAGIEVRMVTGDHPATGLAIGRQLHIADDGDEVVLGKEIDESSEREGLDARLRRARIYARVEPRQKPTIVRALQSAGHFVAVTGDGVNDAPALHAAHIGVAMGKSGTDVARSAADLLLTDDNFASIVNGVEEGRIAYDNVRKVVWLLISTAIAELILFTLSVAFNTPPPLTPVQLLWLNVVTNGIQDIALAFEQGEPGVLDRKPRSPNEQIFNRLMIEEVAASGIYMGIVAFTLFYLLIGPWAYSTFEARNIVLLLMVLFENVHVFNVRSETRSAFRVPIRANRFLILAVLLAQGFHIASMFIPYWSTELLQITPVPGRTWGILLALALSLLVVAEAYKHLRARKLAQPRLGRVPNTQSQNGVDTPKY